MVPFKSVLCFGRLAVFSGANLRQKNGVLVVDKHNKCIYNLTKNQKIKLKMNNTKHHKKSQKRRDLSNLSNVKRCRSRRTFCRCVRRYCRGCSGCSCTYTSTTSSGCARSAPNRTPTPATNTSTSSSPNSIWSKQKN